MAAKTKYDYAVVGDLHLGEDVRYNSVVLSEILQKSKQAANLVLLGDLFHDTRHGFGGLVDGTVKIGPVALASLIDFCQDTAKPIIIILGNHDMPISLYPVTLADALAILRNVKIYDKPTYIDEGILAIPYPIPKTWGVKGSVKLHEALTDALRAFLAEHPSKLLFGHFGLVDSPEAAEMMGTHDIVLQPDDLNTDAALIGHYHQVKSLGDNIFLAGSARAIDYNDTGSTKYIWFCKDGEIVSKSELKRGGRFISLQVNSIEEIPEKLGARDHVRIVYNIPLTPELVDATRERVKPAQLTSLVGARPNEEKAFIGKFNVQKWIRDTLKVDEAEAEALYQELLRVGLLEESYG